MTAKTKDTPEIRELFVDELAGVQGGSEGPCETLDRLGVGCYTTQACCEEGPDNCCSHW